MSRSVGSLLQVGAAGARAHSFAVNVVAQNITNAATPGYTRRSPHMQSVPGPPDGGGGVVARTALRTIDRHVDRRLLGARSDRAGADARLAVSSVLDEVLAEADGNLGGALDAFQTSLRDLAARPGDGATRGQVLARADQLAQAFHRADAALVAAREGADLRIEDGVRRANMLTTEIAALGSEIARVEASGVEASDLRDRRDQRVRELAELVPVEVLDDASGSVTVLLGGREALVTADGRARALSANRDPGTGRMRVEIDSAGVATDVTPWIGVRGSIGGWIEARDGAVASAQAELDSLAFDVATAYNAVHRAGAGLDGVTGRDLFAPLAGSTGAAAAIAVSSDVAGEPDRIAAALDPSTVPGDARNALALIGLEATLSAAGGTKSFGDALASLVASGGAAVQGARLGAEALGAAEQQAIAVHESISGVSVDEEMTRLMEYQRAYEASLKVIQTADEMLETLLALKR